MGFSGMTMMGHQIDCQGAIGKNVNSLMHSVFRPRLSNRLCRPTLKRVEQRRSLLAPISASSGFGARATKWDEIWNYLVRVHPIFLLVVL
jgi:hypothetical protein